MTDLDTPKRRPRGASRLALAIAAAVGMQGACAVSDGVPEGWEAGFPLAPVVTAPDHWSFKAPVAEDVVEHGQGWARNGIDEFVLSGLESQELEPAEEASPEKLLRRVYLTLTGLPPSEAELDDFEANPSDEAYEAVVESLLSSRRYAEHMAASWLDLARYSDTDGFQYDRTRHVWPWRDWVLNAFATNMPFDQFTTHQLAGDLLPDKDEQSVLATAFNRNHPIQGENGLLKNEFRDRYVSDRVDVVGKTWLGLTLACAKCHNHKFDPISAEDYFGIYDCFNQIPEGDNGPSSKFAPTAKADSPLHEELMQDLSREIEKKEASGASKSAVKELLLARKALFTLPKARVMKDKKKRRVTRRLAFGRYDTPIGKGIECRAPASLPPFPEGAPPSRLGLAQWLTMPDNPLTARVVVNRYWRHHFGAGLVVSVDNFGTGTAAPRQQPLLDWLSREFINSGWDLGALHRLIVTSSTFRQSSHSDTKALAADPENEWLARGPRYRLPAEVIRDLPLAASGLLTHRFGGPPVFPYQPPGLWEEMAWEYNAMRYPKLRGDGLFRRSVYTFWRRTLPPPALTIFDAPDREQSAAYREPGVSPQQALALLNGTQFVEAARHLAATVLEQQQSDVTGAIVSAFRRVTSRRPTESELGILTELYDSQLAAGATNQDSMVLLLAVGSSPSSDANEAIAAMTQVVRVIFNLSETVTQE